MDPAEEVRLLETALDAAVEESRQLAAEVGRLDRVASAAAAAVDAWKEGRLTQEHIDRLNRTLLDLLDGAALGVDLTETFQMVPEFTTTALVVHHPQARYFAV